ncbi:hypothetical protein V475_01010 [Sphingobium baderi LL03]|uniref:Uncharacterized protein n=1 Tax=Sphingobium wenxiniae (strain DSM 21828 / CGMCC 1.7748 / JZ-1) TaxID=595605 RepID=A0A562KK73_SPHWJ|nr:hypothetical protein V475_01010 [Sphingobium baderi LL03]TWH95809.1 hypothetical protein IQ35_00891 [Sphingobium wenxiniae]
MVELFPPPFDESPDAPVALRRPRQDGTVKADASADQEKQPVSIATRLDNFASRLSRWAGPATFFAALALIGWLIAH